MGTVCGVLRHDPPAKFIQNHSSFHQVNLKRNGKFMHEAVKTFMKIERSLHASFLLVRDCCIYCRSHCVCLVSFDPLFPWIDSSLGYGK